MIGGEVITTTQPQVAIRNKEKQRAASKRHYEKNKPAMIARAMAFNLKRRDELKALVADYLSQHPCIDCGEDDPIVLEFDHRDPSEKTANIGDMVSRVKGHSVQRVLDEIAKCDVRCANCHRRATFYARRAGAFDHHRDVGTSNLPCATSSGDGLGIHEPGSKTRGARIAWPAPSGRAAEAATCPAVTRSHTARRAVQMLRPARARRGQAASATVPTRGFGRRARVTWPSGSASAHGSCRLPFEGSRMSEPYVRPLGVSLMFASRAEIEAAPAAEREAYYAIVEAFLADPASCDMRRTSAQDLARESELDARLVGINNDWCSA